VQSTAAAGRVAAAAARWAAANFLDRSADRVLGRGGLIPYGRKRCLSLARVTCLYMGRKSLYHVHNTCIIWNTMLSNTAIKYTSFFHRIKVAMTFQSYTCFIPMIFLSYESKTLLVFFSDAD
jgi:hypothetical protein